jgi:uncharacterized cofD-like protein
MTKRLVTVGGGHGQAAMLRALLRLDCDITAVVSVADDGGCSGKLREQFDMPPPGDLRRCLSTLAADRTLAHLFEERFEDEEEDDLRRCAGNLVLFHNYVELGGLAAAAEWAAKLLRCRGRVLPVAEQPARLTIYDRGRGVIEGETTIEREGDRPVVVGVHGPERALPAALHAIAEADVILIGPGSFVTSTLAALMTGDVAEAVVASSATRLWIHNLAAEPGQMTGADTPAYLRLLRDHLCIGSGRDDFELAFLTHGEPHARRAADERTTALTSPLADPASPTRHDPALVARALAHHFQLTLVDPTASQIPPAHAAVAAFDEALAGARARISQRGG